MGIRKLIGSTLLAAALMGILAGAWHLLLMGACLREAVAGLREVYRFDILALAYLALAALMALIYPKGYSGGAPLPEGFRFGVLMGLVCSLPHSMVLYAVSDTLTGTVVLADAAWHMVEQGAGGVVIGLVHGRRAGGEAAAPEATEEQA